MAKFRLRPGFGKHHLRNLKVVHEGQECEMEASEFRAAFLDKFEPVDAGARQVVRKVEGKAEEHELAAAEAAASQTDTESGLERRGPGRPRKE